MIGRVTLSEDVARIAVSGRPDGRLFQTWEESVRTAPPDVREAVTGRLLQGLFDACVRLAQEVEELRAQIEQSRPR